MTDVSVVIPAYNASRYVMRAIDSALSQTGVEVEVVAVNDASTDDTLAVLRGLERPGLRVLDNPGNLGPGGTRNHGISQARGRWIALLDADDAFAAGRLARLVGLAEERGFDAIADLPVHYDLAAGQVAPTQLPASGGCAEIALADLLRPDPETGLDLGLLKPVFRSELGRDRRWLYADGLRHGEDFELYFALIGQGMRFALLREAMYVFSTRIGEISGDYSPGSVTPVDYRGIAAQSDRLAAMPDLPPEIAALLHDRRARALRQNRIYGWTALRKRDGARLRRWLCQDPANRREMAAMLWAKLRGHRGLPD